MSAMLVGYDTLMDKTTVAKNGTGYTSSMKFDRCTGTVCVFLVSTAGSITVTQQCSTDDVNWYNPENTAGAALGGVIATMTVTTGTWVSYSPVMAPYIRFKVKENNSAATIATVKLMFQEEV